MDTLTLRPVCWLTFLLLLVPFPVGNICFGQEPVISKDAKGNRESFERLPTGIIRREIALFTVTGAEEAKNDSLSSIKLVDVPMKRCADNFAYFEKGDIVSLDHLVSIDAMPFDTARHILAYDSQTTALRLIDNRPFWGTNGGVPKREIKSVSYIHVKYMLILPDSAVAGLYEPRFCYKARPKRKRPTAPYCKVLRSEGTGRIYIHMRNGEGTGRYEVTWVIQDGKYYARVVDALP